MIFRQVKDFQTNKTKRVHDQQIFTNENFTEYNPGKQKMILEWKQKVIMIILST